ncbi:hypothetical protein BIW11_12543 [Tropilaelaps mercedesae]|uniref:Uncharacterized protein n=1 Tax=Tropilaelaps mercedesae TaxID=418985 RepID=A0A1V9X5X2_9ACAR|nr:hypothetical protein BIW11_12543 [Tropilaelaps mercedesae]
MGSTQKPHKSRSGSTTSLVRSGGSSESETNNEKRHQKAKESKKMWKVHLKLALAGMLVATVIAAVILFISLRYHDSSIPPRIDPQISLLEIPIERPSNKMEVSEPDVNTPFLEDATPAMDKEIPTKGNLNDLDALRPSPFLSKLLLSVKAVDPNAKAWNLLDDNAAAGAGKAANDVNK